MDIHVFVFAVRKDGAKAAQNGRIFPDFDANKSVYLCTITVSPKCEVSNSSRSILKCTDSCRKINNVSPF